MSASVEIYVKYAGEGQVFAHRVAGLLEVTGYFRTDSGYVLPLDAERWVGVPGWALLDIDRTDLAEGGEPGGAEGTALAPYEYECSLSLRGPLDRLGPMIFERMTQLELPMAYGGDGDIFADYLPGRGVRQFPPGTDVEEPGRPWWFEPSLHADPAARWRAEPPPQPAPPGRAIVFETAGLLQVVQVVRDDGGWRWVTPVASAVTDSGAHAVGVMLGSVLGTTAPTGRADEAAIEASLTAKPTESTVDFGSRSVSVEVRSDGAEVVVLPRGPHPGGPREASSGPVVEELVRHAEGDVKSAALGELVLDLVAALRARVPA